MSYVSIRCNISSRYIKHSRVYTERHLTSAVCIRNSSPSFTVLDVWHNMRSTDREKKKGQKQNQSTWWKNERRIISSAEPIFPTTRLSVSQRFCATDLKIAEVR